jgi:type I restriction enzyme, S subunit
MKMDHENNSQFSPLHSPLPQGYKQTEIGVIPEDWDEQTFGSLYLEPSRNGIYKTAEFQGRGTRIVNMGEMFGYEFISDQDMSRIELTRRELTVNTLQDGDLLFGRRSVVPAGAGKCSLVVAPQESLTFESSIIRVRLNRGKAHPLFYYYFFASQSGRSMMSLIVSGTNIKGIRASELRELKVLFPPTKAEQEAIAEALSDADALIESLTQLIAKKRQLKQGAMQELLTGKRRLHGFANATIGYKQTEVGVIPEDWKVVTANDACIKIQDGTHFSPKIAGNDYLYITSKNIRFGFLDLLSAQRIDEHQHRSIYKRCDVKKGDLLLTKDGANTGNAALNTLDEEFSLLSSVAFLRFDTNKQVTAFYLQQILTQQCQRQIQDAMSGNAITRLTLEKIRKLRFSVPPSIAEQVAIAAILCEMDAEITALEAKLAKAHAIKQGMMHNLLTGRIRLV